MKTTISTFKPTASHPEQAIVMIFDLEGFSKFFSQPDVQDYVPKFLNIVLEAVDLCIKGGGDKFYWLSDPEKNIPALPNPIHSKFLGDGALYVWKYHDFKASQIVSLINRLFNLRRNFSKIVEKAADIIPVIDIPQNIRFGVAAGSVYKLTYENSHREEFIGYSINLASRLQNYSKDIGIIISARLNIKSSSLEKHLYLKKVATKLQGFPKEYVIVDKYNYNKLSNEIKEELFE